MNIPGYESKIAPPSSTGEVINSERLSLAIQKSNAQSQAINAFAGAMNAGAGLAENIGKVFERKNDLSQQALMLSELEQSDRNRGDIGANGEGGVGLLGMLSKNRGELDNWQSTETGDYSEYMKNWEEGQLSTLGQGLKGKWRDQFELEMARRTAEFSRKVDILATTQAYQTIRASNANEKADMIAHPNTDNIAGSILEQGEKVSQMYERGVSMGIYSPEEAAVDIEAFNNQTLMSHFSAVIRDAQDGTAWISKETGESYSGLDGALDIIKDYKELGVLDEQQAGAISDSLMGEDTAKYARGRIVQDQKSIATRNDLTQRMMNGEVFTYNRLVEEAKDATSSEYTQYYNRVGDDNLVNQLWAIQEGILKPPKPEDYLYPDSIMKAFNDTSIDKSHFQQLLSANWEKLGIPQDEMLKLMAKSKPVADQATGRVINNAIDAAFDPIIDSFKGDEEKQAEWEQRKQSVAFQVSDIMASDEIKTLDDMNKVLDNIRRVQFEGQVLKDYTRPDRGTNDVELIGQQMQLGYFRGVSSLTPELAEMTLKVQTQQVAMAEFAYGKENVIEQVEGTRGSEMEGRVIIHIKDPNDVDPYGNAKEKWVKVDLVADDKGNLEEVFREVTIDDKFDSRNPNWQPSTAMTDAVEADKAGKAAGRRDTLHDLLPQPNPPLSVVEEMNNWYRDNSDGAFIPLDTVMNFLSTNYHSPNDTEMFFENIYEKSFNAVESNLNSAVANGALDIFRNNGKVRWGAKAAISQYISRYGLPPTYSERILKDVFGVE